MANPPNQTTMASTRKNRFIYRFSADLLLLYSYIIWRVPGLNCLGRVIVRGGIMPHNTRDQDAAKGATEAEDHKISENVGLQEQLGHRDQELDVKGCGLRFSRTWAKSRT
jgi:hypothetical protein